MVPFVATTDNITVTVRPVYLDSKSSYFARRFVFGYFVTIANASTDAIRLLKRHWCIVESGGRTQVVDGDGVIGKQPLIASGDEHSYSSYSVLGTFTGTMEGHYTMERANGEQFQVAIPRFPLRAMAN